MTLVREFHETFGLTANATPTVPSDADIRLRIRLIKEETEEVVEELVKLLRSKQRGGRWPEQVKILQNLLGELADLRYVLEGTAVTMGLPIDEAFRAVHTANMTKVWPDGSIRRDAGGKVVKPPTHVPADMSAFVFIHDTTGELVA
jgi:predicted HAD superfamily Cof-like phosphohydrolase